jgi:hypothetical protein
MAQILEPRKHEEKINKRKFEMYSTTETAAVHVTMSSRQTQLRINLLKPSGNFTYHQV